MIKRTNVIESLERRTLLSGSSLLGGVLRVNGDFAARNVIAVTNNSEMQTVDVRIESYSIAGALIGTHTRSYSNALPLNEIRVSGGFLADDIRVGSDAGGAALDVNTRVASFGGNDRIRTNGGNDIVFGGAGNDDVNAGHGNNWVRGDLGNDLLVTGDGNDRVAGNGGNDLIFTLGGNDLALGQGGNDAIDAGAGNDVVFGHWGNDALGGGEGDDAVWGGLGDDALSGGAGDDRLGGFFGINSLTGDAGADTFLVPLTNRNAMDFDAAEGDVVTQVGARADGGTGPAL